MELEDHIFFLCTQVVERRNRLLQEALKPLDMLPTEYRVLSALLRKGGLTMQELSQWTAFERTRITHILHGMEARDWVKRTVMAHDRRNVVSTITPSGQAVFDKAKVVVDAVTDDITRANSPEDLDELRRTLRTMRTRLIEMGT
ncbi:MarR family winged helix-turn-helix transcriptional regulator [Variovorax sp.]|uniref:MarR family winged helix-turn-helix transcriptional regulator n=1 Tax=Variovorax sp. TaxID=1871043 RepID=UPI002D47F8FD|nr:MarR family transcriptional regulator [Variovorax sp.]HYP83964.1 MarR family transcriptional regulator [Variovorax sp.]